MNIKDQEAHDLARELAALTGRTLTEAVRVALRHEVKRTRMARANQDRPLAARLHEIAMRCAALPDIDPRPPDEVLGYDEHGLPR